MLFPAEHRWQAADGASGASLDLAPLDELSFIYFIRTLAYTTDSRWRNRAEFANGRSEIVAFLTRKWAKELDYRLIKELWAFTENRIAVRYVYEWHDDSDNWFRSYGNENWEYDASGLMQRRFACINDLPIAPSDRKYHWPLGRRPDGHPGLSDLGL